jgi:hypothetical protein
MSSTNRQVEDHARDLLPHYSAHARPQRIVDLDTAEANKEVAMNIQYSELPSQNRIKTVELMCRAIKSIYMSRISGSGTGRRALCHVMLVDVKCCDHVLFLQLGGIRKLVCRKERSIS